MSLEPYAEAAVRRFGQSDDDLIEDHGGTTTGAT